MTLTRQKKEQIVKELKDWIRQSQIVVFVNFHGLSNALSQEVRGLLKVTGARYLVAKKTLIKRSLADFNFSGELLDLEGEVALVFSQSDALAAAKAICQFSKQHEEIKLLGGIFENAYVNKAAISVLASLPPERF
jgi:large subunit ribosomal protein L10